MPVQRIPISSEPIASLGGRLFEDAHKLGVIASLKAVFPAGAPDIHWRPFGFEESLEARMEAIARRAHNVGNARVMPPHAPWMTFLRQFAVATYLEGEQAGRDIMERLRRDLQRPLKTCRAGVWAPSAFVEFTEAETEVPHAWQELATAVFGPLCPSRDPADPERVFGIGQGRIGRSDFALLINAAGPGDQPRYAAVVLEYGMTWRGPLPTTENLDLVRPYAREDHARHLTSLAAAVPRRALFSDLSFDWIGERSAGFRADGHGEAMRRAFAEIYRTERPFAKLCQACSYAEDLDAAMARLGIAKHVLHVCAVTPQDALNIAWEDGDVATGAVVSTLGAVYRGRRKADIQDASFEARLRAVNEFLAELLDGALRTEDARRVKAALSRWLQGEWARRVCVARDASDLKDIQETARDAGMSLSFTLRAGEDFQSLTAPLVYKGKEGTLRDHHRDEIMAWLERHAWMIDDARRAGTMPLLALAGHPGIGKTTSIISTLREWTAAEIPTLFIYLSPRTKINNDVFNSCSSFAYTFEVNHNIIQNAFEIARALGQGGRAPWLAMPCAWPSGASAPPDLDILQDNALRRVTFLASAEWMEERGRIAKRAMVGDAAMGRPAAIDLGRGEAGRRSIKATVLKTAAALVAAACDDRGMRAIALTMCLQSLRETEQFRTAMRDMLRAGVESGRRVVVMLDEVAGAETGGLCVRETMAAAADIMSRRQGGSGPALIVSDASICAEEIFGHWLERLRGFGEEDAEDRDGIANTVLIAETRRDGGGFVGLRRHDRTFAFRPDRDGHAWTVAMTCLEANAFPASEIQLTYDFAASPVPIDTPASLASARQNGPSGFAAVMRGQQDWLERTILTELALLRSRPFRNGQGKPQILAFVQNKNTIENLQYSLAKKYFESHDEHLKITPVFAWTTTEIDDATKLDTDVWLVTSSASRGLSLPLVRSIIACVPQFDTESQFAELVQLIYRGRGGLKAPDGAWIDGDDGPRRIRFLFQEHWRLADFEATRDVEADEGEGDAEDIRVVEQPQEAEAERARRNAINLLSTAAPLLGAFVTLHGSLMTRLAGEARLRSPLVLAPLGGVDVPTSGDQHGLLGTLNSIASVATSVSIHCQEGAIKNICDTIRNVVVKICPILKLTDKTLHKTSDPGGDDAAVSQILAMQDGGRVMMDALQRSLLAKSQASVARQGALVFRPRGRGRGSSDASRWDASVLAGWYLLKTRATGEIAAADPADLEALSRHCDKLLWVLLQRDKGRVPEEWRRVLESAAKWREFHRLTSQGARESVIIGCPLFWPSAVPGDQTLEATGLQTLKVALESLGDKLSFGKPIFQNHGLDPDFPIVVWKPKSSIYRPTPMRQAMASQRLGLGLAMNALLFLARR